MFDYHSTDTRSERLAKGTDHCESAGPVHDLAHLVVEDRVVDPEQGGELTTTAVHRLIYAVSVDFRVHVGFDGERGKPNAVKHETLFHNDPVEAAGEMQFENGVLVGFNDQSGSYGTMGLMKSDRRIARALLKALEEANVPMTDGVLDSLRELGGL